MNNSFKKIDMNPKTQILISELTKIEANRPYGFSIFKNFIFLIDAVNGNVIIINKETSSIIKNIFINKFISGITIDTINEVVFVTSYKKLFRASINDLIHSQYSIFSEFNHEIRLDADEFFNGALAFNSTEKELYFVVKNLKTKRCKIYHFYTEIYFNENMFLNDTPIKTICGYHLDKHRVVEPCIIDEKLTFSNIHSIHYIEKEKVLVAFCCSAEGAFVLTSSGVYIKTIHGFEKGILDVIYDETNSTFVSTYLDSRKMSVYYYENQEILGSTSFEIQDIQTMRQVPIAFDKTDCDVMVYNGHNSFMVFTYEKELPPSSPEYFLTIQDSPSFRSPELAEFENEFSPLFKEITWEFDDAGVPPLASVTDSDSFDLSEFLNARIPLTELPAGPSHLTISTVQPNHAKRANRTFSAINEKNSVVPLVCKKFRISNLDEDNELNFDINSFLKLTDSKIFLDDYSSLDDSWKTKDIIYPEPEHCEWRTSSSNYEILSISEISQLIE